MIKKLTIQLKKNKTKSRTIKSAPKAGKISLNDIKRAVKIVSESHKKKYNERD